MLKRKIKQRKETYIWSVGRGNINIQITCQGNPPTEKMTFKWNSEGSEEMSHLVIGGGPSKGWRNSKCKALRQEHDQQVQNRRDHSGWGRMNKGRRRRFSPERPQNPVMSLTGASLGTADTSPRPTPSEYLPAFLLWIFRNSLPVPMLWHFFMPAELDFFQWQETPQNHLLGSVGLLSQFLAPSNSLFSR